MAPPAIEVHGLTFAYQPSLPAVLRQVELTIEHGERWLLVGANGAGKTTLLRLIGGKHLVPPDRLRVLGRPAFHDTSLVAQRAFLGGPFPLDVDIRVAEILAGIDSVDSVRQRRLIDLLGVDTNWRMHQISDGQRRRVQLLLGLLPPRQVLLLDEITTDLDLLARADLLAFLREESTRRGVAILCATHILDRLEDWASHIAHLDSGQVRQHHRLDRLPALAALRARRAASPLTELVHGWLREDLARRANPA
jgi:CCR4-NOT complex subunit CAF16